MTTILYYYQFIDDEACGKVKIGKMSNDTYKHYKSRYKQIVDYLEILGTKDISPAEITPFWVKRFENYLLTQKKHKQNYCNKHLRHLHKALMYAKMDQVITQHPMENFKYVYENKYKADFLTIEELRLLEEVKLSKTLEPVRDLYVLSCYTGFAFKDATLFSYQNITINKHGVFVSQNRIKSNSISIIPLLPKTKQLLEKYSGVMPSPKNQTYNRYLKRILAQIGINRNLSSHSARKTFGMIMHNEHGVPLDTVSKMLGHKSITTTQKWYVKTDYKKIATDMRDVITRLQTKQA